jgi:hypothetical protein
MALTIYLTVTFVQAYCDQYPAVLDGITPQMMPQLIALRSIQLLIVAQVSGNSSHSGNKSFITINTKTLEVNDPFWSVSRRQTNKIVGI